MDTMGIANRCIKQLGIEHVQIDIRLCDGDMPDNRNGDLGLCEQWTNTRYTVNVNTSVNVNHNPVVTLAHELYHVMEFVFGYAANEILCDAYGRFIAEQ